MNKKKKRRLIAYSLRFLVGLILTICIVLMICGCLYIHEHLHPTKVEAAINSKQTKYSVSLAEALENQKQIIMLDPGHGGKDQGTCNKDILEKDINLTVALQMKELLEKQGFSVLISRETDDFIELADRTEMANDKNVDLFVSIHCNYCQDSKDVAGLECYYFTDTSSGKRYAEDLISYLEDKTAIATRGAKPEDFYVLRNTNAPAVLVELGYMSNASECQKLNDSSYQKELSQALVNAITSTL